MSNLESLIKEEMAKVSKEYCDIAAEKDKVVFEFDEKMKALAERFNKLDCEMRKLGDENNE